MSCGILPVASIHSSDKAVGPHHIAGQLCGSVISKPNRSVIVASKLIENAKSIVKHTRSW
jgi:hypothetical protein